MVSDFIGYDSAVVIPINDIIVVKMYYERDIQKIEEETCTLFGEYASKWSNSILF